MRRNVDIEYQLVKKKVESNRTSGGGGGFIENA
jgi:hypothetical protein